MARAKRIYILMIKVKKLFPLLWSWCFLKKIKKTCSLGFYRVIEKLVKVLENSQKLWKLPTARAPTAFLILQTFTHVSIL